MNLLSTLVERLALAGITLLVEKGRLRYRAARGVFTDELRALVGAHKEELIAFLQEEGNSYPPLLDQGPSERGAERAAGPGTEHDLTLQRVEQLLLRGQRLARDRPGWQRVLEVFANLARRWHAVGDPMLNEIESELQVLLPRWEQEDQQAQRHQLPPGWH
jgi:hypothetical protein